MRNSELLKNILKKMEENHLNLYHSIEKGEIEKYISEIQNLDDMNSVEFDGQMLKLFSLFKDSHTSYSVPIEFLDKRMLFVGGKLYVQQDGDFKEVVTLGGVSAEEVIKSMTELINCETKEYLCDKIDGISNNGYYYRLLNVAKNEKIVCEVLNKNKVEKVEIEIISPETFRARGLARNNIFYDFEIREDVLVVKYRKCFEHEDYPFSQFVQDLESVIEEHNLKQYVLDVRNNRGGFSKILKPFEELVRWRKMDGVVLMNNGTFSGGRFAVRDFKRAFGTLLVGEGTGGAVKSYGNRKELCVEDKHFSVSTAFFDMSDTFGYEGSIRPDIFVLTTIEDIRNNFDRQLETAVKVLKEKTN